MSARDEDEAEALHREGVERSRSGDHVAAERAYRAALALDPRRVATLNNLALARRARGDLGEAADLYRQAYELGSRTKSLLTNAAKNALELSDGAAALRYAKDATELFPTAAPGWKFLSNAHAALDDPKAALDALERGLAHADDKGFIEHELGLYWVRADDDNKALMHLERAVTAMPESVEVLEVLGNVLARLERVDEAFARLEHAIRIDPERVPALHALAAVSILVGECGRAAEHATRAMQLAGDDKKSEIGSMRLFALSHYEGCSREELFDISRAWGVHEASVVRAKAETKAASEVRPRRAIGAGKLRIAYVSSDFNEHVVIRFAESVIAAHDPETTEVVLVSFGNKDDATTERLRKTYWFEDLSSVDPDVARERLLALELDVAIDLAGHSGEPVLRHFARRFAPLQVTWLGYPGTTGLDSIDLRITDALVDPPGAERDYTETLARLRRAPWVYLSREPLRDVTSRESAGDVVFGCFNRAAKLGPAALEMFGQVLAAVPGSRLLLRTKALASGPAARRIDRVFGSLGVRDRVEVLPYGANDAAAHAGYGQIDIALDSFPYHGTTTTCDALRMGVPVVSRIGPWPASRVSSSLLDAVGLADLAVEGQAAFVDAAARLAGDSVRRRELRRDLRSRFLDGPLGDAPSLARELERVFREALDARGR